MKRFAIILLAAAASIGSIGIASSAPMHGGARAGAQGGNWSGGSSSGHWSGGNWSGNHWNGGNWHGGNWHGGSRTRVFVGLGFGAPFWGWGWWPGYYPYYAGYYYPYYAPYYTDYYPYDYSAPRYIQKGDEQSGQSTDYSYYCPDPAGYYPQVQTCSRGWLRVAPQNAPGPSAPAQR
jgi:hypothetical protein